MPYLGKSFELQDREAWYASLRASPPTRHPRWIEYLVATSTPGARHGELTQFGDWLMRRYRDEATDLHTRWLKKHHRTA